MATLNNIAETLTNMPFEVLLIIVALSAIGLAAFAIHAVTAVVKGRRH